MSKRSLQEIYNEITENFFSIWERQKDIEDIYWLDRKFDIIKGDIRQIKSDTEFIRRKVNTIINV